MSSSLSDAQARLLKLQGYVPFLEEILKDNVEEATNIKALAGVIASCGVFLDVQRLTGCELVCQKLIAKYGRKYMSSGLTASEGAEKEEKWNVQSTSKNDSQEDKKSLPDLKDVLHQTTNSAHRRRDDFDFWTRGAQSSEYSADLSLKPQTSTAPCPPRPSRLQRYSKEALSAIPAILPPPPVNSLPFPSTSTGVPNRIEPSTSSGPAWNHRNSFRDEHSSFQVPVSEEPFFNSAPPPYAPPVSRYPHTNDRRDDSRFAFSGTHAISSRRSWAPTYVKKAGHRPGPYPAVHRREDVAVTGNPSNQLGSHSEKYHHHRNQTSCAGRGYGPQNYHSRKPSRWDDPAPNKAPPSSSSCRNETPSVSNPPRRPPNPPPPPERSEIDMESHDDQQTPAPNAKSPSDRVAPHARVKSVHSSEVFIPLGSANFSVSSKIFPKKTCLVDYEHPPPKETDGSCIDDTADPSNSDSLGPSTSTTDGHNSPPSTNDTTSTPSERIITSKDVFGSDYDSDSDDVGDSDKVVPPKPTGKVRVARASVKKRLNPHKTNVQAVPVSSKSPCPPSTSHHLPEVVNEQGRQPQRTASGIDQYQSQKKEASSVKPVKKPVGRLRRNECLPMEVVQLHEDLKDYMRGGILLERASRRCRSKSLSEAANDEPRQRSEDESSSISPSRKKSRDIQEESEPERNEMADSECQQEKANENLQVSGLAGQQLFVCGNIACDERTESAKALQEHLMVCDLARDSPVLACKHCGSNFKQVAALLCHLKYHGVKRYACGLCNKHRGFHSRGVRRHLKEVHSVLGRIIEVAVGSSDLIVVQPQDK